MSDPFDGVPKLELEIPKTLKWVTCPDCKPHQKGTNK